MSHQLTTGGAHQFAVGDTLTLSGFRSRRWWQFWIPSSNGTGICIEATDTSIVFVMAPPWWRRLVWWP